MKAQCIASLGIALSLLGCANGDLNQESTVDTDWQLVDRAYPYEGKFGETVCSEVERYEDGRRFVIPEFYHFQVMNDALLGKGPLAPDVISAINAAGISRVGTCQEARDYMRAQREFVERDADKARRAAPVDAEPVIQKVANGHSSGVLDVVRVQPWHADTRRFGTCSGVMIGKRVLLTAAHCFASDGVWDVRVDRGRNSTSESLQCLSGGNSCLNTPSGLNARVFRFPGFSGETDSARDLAIVINNADWGAGTTFSLDFMPITETRVPVGTSYFVDGYGAHASDFSGSGVHWIANEAQGIDDGFTGYWRDEVQQGVGRPCKGDSGGPAINTDKIRGGLFGPDLVIGLAQNANGVSDTVACPSPGAFFRYTRVSDKLAFIDQTLTNNGLAACSRLGGSGRWAYRYCGL